jgi:hypothetical protein
MRWRFSLRSVMLGLFLIAVALAVVTLKLRQDFRKQAAWSALRTLGMHESIAQEPGHRTMLVLVSRQPTLTESDVDRLLAALDVLQGRHDLGLSKGVEIERIDLTMSTLPPAALARLRERLPATEIRH